MVIHHLWPYPAWKCPGVTVFLCWLAGYLTSLLSDSAALAQLSTSLNSAFELAQQSGLNLQALGHALDTTQSSQIESQLRAQTELTQMHLHLPPGSSAVVTNGRVMVVQSDSLGLHDAFSAEDFALLVNHAVTHAVQRMF